MMSVSHREDHNPREPFKRNTVYLSSKGQLKEQVRFLVSKSLTLLLHSTLRGYSTIDEGLFDAHKKGKTSVGCGTARMFGLQEYFKKLPRP